MPSITVSSQQSWVCMESRGRNGCLLKPPLPECLTLYHLMTFVDVSRGLSPHAMLRLAICDKRDCVSKDLVRCAHRTFY